MSYHDKFAPAPTFRKTSTDVAKVNARKAANVYKNIAEEYAKAVQQPLTPKVQELINDFRSALEISPKQHLNRVIKQQWQEYYRTHA